MRIVILGASALAVLTCGLLLDAGHEVVIIEADHARIEELAETLDCGFIHGDGTRPAILREAAPERADVLFCLTGNDQANIIASLVGRSLGFSKVVTMVSGEEFEHICLELGLEHTIIPNRTIAGYLTDMLIGQDALETSAVLKHDARIFSFVVHRKEDAVAVKELGLPKGARIICLYREEQFKLADGETVLKPDDEVVILTHNEHLPALRERWGVRDNGDHTNRAQGGDASQRTMAVSDGGLDDISANDTDSARAGG